MATLADGADDGPPPLAATATTIGGVGDGPAFAAGFCGAIGMEGDQRAFALDAVTGSGFCSAVVAPVVVIGVGGSAWRRAALSATAAETV